MKIKCRVCALEKDCAEFNPNMVNKSWKACRSCTREKAKNYYKNNREKCYASARKWAKNNPEKLAATIRAIWLKRAYGITVEQYEDMYRAQNGVCAICHGVNLNGTRLCVDHNHDTKKVRDLLCRKCNSFLGYIREDKEVGRRMSEYLEKHENRSLV